MKYISLIIALLCLGWLFAEPTYVPTTTIAEDFGADWCDGCTIAWQGLQVLHNNTHNGELISARLYTESGALSNPIVQERFDYYQVVGLPAMLFNGKIRIDGSDVGIGDGTLYNAALNQFRYASTSVKMQISSFGATTGILSGSVEMVSPTNVIEGAKVVYYLVENDVTATDTHVVRTILYDDISLSGAGSTFNFNKTFTLNPSWNTNNLWAIASVQLANKAIIQSASSLPLPTYNFRASMDWNPQVEGQANLSYQSSPFWLFNLGAPDNYTIRIVVDSSPADWYFNFCGEDGNCYPGDLEHPFSLGTNESIAYHVNLWVGSPGIANYRFVVTSPNIGTYSVPFRYKVEGVANEDLIELANPLSLGGMFPNPVIQTGELELTSAKNLGGASIEIFNLKGQKVQSVNAANLTKGTNRIVFSPASEMPNGVYFYRLEGSNAPARKFVLMK